MNETQQTAAQDVLRTARQWIDAFDGLVNNDQSYAGTDSTAYSPPGQFVVVGPRSTSVEGSPISTTAGGGIVLSPAVVFIAVGVIAAMIWKG